MQRKRGTPIDARQFSVAADGRLVDEEGGRWELRREPGHRAYAAEAAWRLGALLELPLPEAHRVEIEGISGVLVQEVRASATLARKSPDRLEDGQLAEAANLQAFEWLIANPHTPGRTLALDERGHVVPLEHAGALTDRALLEYDLASGRPNAAGSWFARFWEAVQDERVPLDLARLARFVDRVEALPARAIEAIVGPLARLRRAAPGYALACRLGAVTHRGEAELAFALRLRQRALRRDLARFLDQLHDGRTAGRRSLPAGQGAARAPVHLDAALLAVRTAPVVLHVDGAASLGRPAGARAALAAGWRAASTAACWLADRAVGAADRARGAFTAGEAARLMFLELRDSFTLRDRLERTRPSVLRLLAERARFVAEHGADPVAAANAARMVRILAEPAPASASADDLLHPAR